ncbi:inner membrane protein YhjD [Kibdelosporangium philippinense]|uniref:Inner membrane protein YhjD n=1 Tax=Kibdelosporangium philippinense TaxID=211113 RepID=A0ABS8ZG89_9PSEU|nr:inner membrane protein YhjD [Kibdelosporangium philippinense]MCE7005920.1 inner membrane protein YhjD [Kibdelosporangium philippinense]
MGKLDDYRRKWRWLDHLIRANDAFSERYGNQFAAAITYFSVLSLFPLLMIAFAVAGFILAAQPELLMQLKDGITKAVPGTLGETVNQVVTTALDSKGMVGILGLIAALYSGIGWMTNLRDALTAQWGHERKQLPLISSTLKDLVALISLGLALVVSFGLTAAGTGLGNLLLRLVGLEGAGWARFLLFLATLVLSVIANWVVFLWVLTRLPREKVNVRSAVKGALAAAIGFEILKQLGAIYLNVVTSSPTGAIFGPVIGLLVFANLVARFLLFITAWTATTSRPGTDGQSGQAEPSGQGQEQPDEQRPEPADVRSEAESARSRTPGS